MNPPKKENYTVNNSKLYIISNFLNYSDYYFLIKFYYEIVTIARDFYKFGNHNPSEIKKA